MAHEVYLTNTTDTSMHKLLKHKKKLLIVHKPQVCVEIYFRKNFAYSLEAHALTLAVGIKRPQD